MRIHQLQSGLFRLNGACLDEQNAGNDLQTVGDAMLHLFQQHVLFPQEILHLLLNRTPGGNVLKCQKHCGAGAVLKEDLAGIQAA